MKKILVLAGGYDQIALIKELKKYECEIILVDYYQNPPAKNFSDKHYCESTLDVDKVEEIARNENVDLVITACTDQALLTMAKVSEKLHLPCYLTYKKALNVTNKLYMKDIFLKSGIPTSDYVILNNDNINDINLKFPMVVKPCDCNSSKGVKKVRNNEELYIAVKDALKYSRTNNAIVEEFKEGYEISIDAYVKNNVSTVLSITKTCKVEKNRDNFTIYKSVYPSGINSIVENKINDIVSNIANSFELNNCPILVQAIVNDNDISVLEFSARMGGGTKYQLIEYISGVNIMKEYVSMIMTGNASINIKKSKKFIELDYLYCNNGIFSQLVNFNVAKADGLIAEFYQYKTRGMLIDECTNSGDRAAGILVIADSLVELNDKKNKIFKTIKILDEQGNNILDSNIYSKEV